MTSEELKETREILAKPNPGDCCRKYLAQDLLAEVDRLRGLLRMGLEDHDGRMDYSDRGNFWLNVRKEFKE